MTAPATLPDTSALFVTRQSVTLRQRVCEKLREAIVEQRLPPGTKLIERDLCEQLGVSRPSLREALRHLESDKLIEMVPHKGSVVATLTEHDVREIYDVRAALEGPACEKFTSLASEDDIVSLLQAHTHLCQAVRKDDRAGIRRAKSAFYQGLFAGSGCVISQTLVASLNVRIEVLRRMAISQKDRNQNMLAEFEPIIQAAQKRNGAAMKAGCIAHLENAKTAALAQLAKMERDSSARSSKGKNNSGKQQGERR